MNDTNEYPLPYVHILSHVHDPEAGVFAKAKLIAPLDSIYKNHRFDIEIKVPKDYPFKPPKITFLTKIFHPNVYHNNGGICCCTIPELKDNWSPAYTIPKMLAKIVEMIEDPDRYLSDCGDQETIKLYKNNREEFERKAEEWC